MHVLKQQYSHKPLYHSLGNRKEAKEDFPFLGLSTDLSQIDQKKKRMWEE